MPSNEDYIDPNDAVFIAWSANFFTVLNTNIAAVGLVAGDVTPVSNARDLFSVAYTDQVAKEAAATAAVALKRTRRTTYVPQLRALVKRIQAHPGMTDSLRGQLGVTVPKRTRTRRGVGSEVPGVVLEPKPGQVIIHFGDNPGNEQTNGKPAWAAGCNIYRKFPEDFDFVLIAFDTASPYVDTIKGAARDVSYKVAYRGIRASDEGARSPEQTIAAGG